MTVSIFAELSLVATNIGSIKIFSHLQMTNEILLRNCLTVSANSTKYFGKFGPDFS